MGACAAGGACCCAIFTASSPLLPPHRKLRRQRQSVPLADGERNTKGRPLVRTSIHWDENTGDLRSNLPIPQPPRGAPPQHGVSALSSHASSSRSPTRPPEGVPARRQAEILGEVSSLRVGRRRLRCASTGGRGFSCGVVRAQGSSLLSSTPYHHLVPVLPEKVTSPRIGLLCLREHPRAAGWGCGWS